MLILIPLSSNSLAFSNFSFSSISLSCLSLFLFGEAFFFFVNFLTKDRDFLLEELELLCSFLHFLTGEGDF